MSVFGGSSALRVPALRSIDPWPDGEQSDLKSHAFRRGSFARGLEASFCLVVSGDPCLPTVLDGRLGLGLTASWLSDWFLAIPVPDRACGWEEEAILKAGDPRVVEFVRGLGRQGGRGNGTKGSRGGKVPSGNRVYRSPARRRSAAL